MGEAAPTPHTMVPKLGRTEPWRWGRLDVGREEELCTGEVDWEPGTGWWICPKCGHVGAAPYFGHYPAKLPRPPRKYGSFLLLVGAALLGAVATIGALLKSR